MARDPWETEKTELSLYMDNDREVYSRKLSFIANVQRKLKAGTYDAKLAPKLWRHFVDFGAKKYVREHSRGERIDLVFPTAMRNALAEEYAKEELAAIRRKEYDDYTKPGAISRAQVGLRDYRGR